MAKLSEEDRESLDEYVRTHYGADAYRIVGACPLLWNGWERDTLAVLVELPDGRRVWAMVDPFAVREPGGIVPTLRQRITAYRQALAETEALLMVAGEM